MSTPSRIDVRSTLVILVVTLAVGLALSPSAGGSPPARAQPAGLTPTMVFSTYLALVTKAPAPAATTITTTTISIPAHAYTDALVRLTSTYGIDYNYLDRGKYDPVPVANRTFTLLVLENQYLRLSILPELGGRVYQLIFKPTGQKLFYQNPVLKPSPWGPPEMGWWLAAGGIEWCLPVEEHGYEWDEPWSYAIDPGADGITVTLSDTTAADRLRARVAVSLRDGEALFHLAPRVENPTAGSLRFKFWLNAMLAPGDANAAGADLRFIWPSSAATVHSTGDPRLPPAGSVMSWPVYNGVDWSRLGNWRQWFGFFAYPQAGGFQSVYDTDAGIGIVRAYDNSVARGAKFFGFGWGAEALPPSLYTDDSSAYVEMHGGLAPTFADDFQLDSGQSAAWEEQWYPAAQLGGLTWANARAALWVEQAPAIMRLHLLTPRAQPDVRVELRRRADETLLFSADVLSVGPTQPYHSPAISTTLGLSDVSVLVYSRGQLLGAFGNDPATRY